MLALTENKPVKNIKPWVYKIIDLASSSRHDVTYHYHGILNHISRGYTSAFLEKNLLNAEFAFATELQNIDSDRSYYVDLAIQTYLQDKIGIQNLIDDTQEDFLNLMSSCHKILSKLLSNYHNRLKA
jgi:hypothetical protein